MKGTVNKPRMLPVIKFGETEFYVDVRLDEFRQVDAPWNSIPMDEIRESPDEGTALAFDKTTKNVYREIIDPANLPSDVVLVVVPPLRELDPVGLARKQGLPDNTYLNNKESAGMGYRQVIKRKKGLKH